jgi:hypothetical protein
MRRVLVSAPFAFSLRNFVATGLCSRLADELGDAVLVSPYADAAFSGPDGRPVRNVRLPADDGEWGIPKPAQVTFIDEQWKYLHMTGFAQEYPDGSLQMMTMGTNRNPRWWAARVLRFLAPRGSALRSALRNLNEARRPRRAVIREIFDRETPSLVVVASPGHYWADQFVMEEASRRRIPTLCVVLSWDNLYSRGPLVRRPDHLAVWSTAMRRQAEQVHDYPSGRIHEVGALQFGYYAEPVSPAEDAAMRAATGLAPGEKYLAYVCGARTARYDVEDLHAMIEALRPTEFGGMKVVVRPHPQGDRRVYAGLLADGVLLDASPDLTDGKTRPDAVNRDAIRHMAAFLSGAEYVLSSWGTTALLEATLLDRPTIQFRWMDSVAHSDPSDVAKVRDFQRYLHMRDFDEPGARLYSESPADLAPAMRRQRDNSPEFATRRRTLVARLVKLPLDGCVSRVVETCMSVTSAA